MDLGMFGKDSSGALVDVDDPVCCGERYKAFIPALLPDGSPTLTTATHLAVANARAALAGLDSTARHLPNPTLLRTPTLRREAQSTSALEGTYAPLNAVLVADEDAPQTPDLREILNYVRMADHAFAWVSDGRPLSLTPLIELQQLLMAGTPMEPPSGRGLRDVQVVIGRRSGAATNESAIAATRFVPPPPGNDLQARVQHLMDWMGADRSDRIDPVVATAMAHYQFETLHPFPDGNGRMGRLLVVLQLMLTGVLTEPTLAFSPWFEARRTGYYDRLLAVSTTGDWDGFIRFFALGLAKSATDTHTQILALASVQTDLKNIVRSSSLRADSAHALVDLAVANPSFTVRKVEEELGLSYGRANKLVAQLVGIGVLEVLDADAYRRRFFAPQVLDVLLGRQSKLRDDTDA